MSGGKSYDGKAVIPSTSLTIADNFDGANLTLSGAAVLSGRNAGSETVVVSTVTAPVRMQTAFATTGNQPLLSRTPIAYSATLSNVPGNGNTLVAVIATRGASANQVASITQSGASWTRAVQAVNANGTTTEIWYAPGVQNAGTVVTITNSTAVRAAAVVLEYSGVLTTSALDQTASASGSGTAAVTGTTAPTTAQPEVWVGGVGLASSGYTLTTIIGEFGVVSTNCTVTTPTLNAKVYALECITNVTGAAHSGGTVAASQWSGAMATFFGVPGLALAGSAVPNYTLATVSGLVTVSQANLAVTAAANTKLYDGTTAAAAVPSISAGSIQSGDAAPVWTESYSSPNAGTGLTLTPAGVVNDGNNGLNYSYTYTQVATGEIDPAPLTVTAVGNTKTYDGGITALATPTVSGLVGSDTVTGLAETYDTQNYGTGKTLAVSAYTVNDGNSGANYTVSTATSTAGEIDQAPLTVTAVGNTKTYDGTTTAAATPTVSGLVGSDTVTGLAETYDTPNAGTGKTLTVSAYTVNDGNSGANYTVSTATSTAGEIDPLGTTTGLAVDINPAGLTTNVTFTATVSGVASAATVPTGDVVFSANGTPFATNGLPRGVGPSRPARPLWGRVPTRLRRITLGDGNFQSSVSSPLSEVVTNNVIYSHTNVITSVISHHNGTYTLNLEGTPGAQYYVVYSGTVKAQMTTWAPVVGSTNTASVTDGTWSCVVSNPAPAYYRPVAVNPAQ